MKLPFARLRKEVKISNNKRLIFISGSPTNLFFHVLNIYGMLGQHGAAYEEKKSDTPRIEIRNILNKNQRFPQLVRKLVDTDPKSPDELFKAFTKDEYERTFSEILQESWRNFYKEYWLKNGERPNVIFQKNVENQDWKERAEKVEKLTDSRLSPDFYLIGAEALAGSAMIVPPNIVIGCISENFDFGFLHEGLHLLLKEKWADDPRISSMIPKNWNQPDGWGKNWKGKFEQAIVVSLDALVRKMNKEERHRYYAGNGVADLEQFFFEPFKNWYGKKMKNQTKEKIADVVHKILVANEERAVARPLHIYAGGN